MEKEELIGILKSFLGEKDIEFLRKLDEAELMKLIMFIRDKDRVSEGDALSRSLS